MNKQLTLGSVQLELRFKMGILKHMKDLAGMDPLIFITENSNDTFTFASVIINAGIRCMCDSTGKDYPDREMIDKTISAEMDIKDVAILTGYLNEFLNVGEQQSPAGSE